MQAYRQSFDSADYTIKKYKINANETIYGTQNLPYSQIKS